MKRTNLFALLVILITTVAFSCEEKKDIFDKNKAKTALDIALGQYQKMIQAAPDDQMPRTFQNDTMVYSNIHWWCSGFYPGTLWYLYEYSQDEAFKQEAHKRTLMLAPIQFRTDDHDVGFMLYCSYGNALRITGDTSTYAQPLINGALSLATRFNETTGVIKSWDWDGGKRWAYPVIIDNMMNLELLMWASKYSDNEELAHISKSHSNTTLANHYRSDNSTWHVLDYDTITGKVLQKMTHQGYKHESAWARGQAWGLYGYTMMYRETKDTTYLEHAKKIANFMLDHPNMPTDMVPYWDYDAPNIPNEVRDASAATIMTSALLELSGYVSSDLQKKYFTAAEVALQTLSSPEYLAQSGTNGNFILKHSVGAKPFNSEVDVPLSYADYYFVEALLRYLKGNE